VLPPTLIYKGKNVQRRWRCDDVLGADASFAASPNGWTDTELSVSWLERFHILTEDRWSARTTMSELMDDSEEGDEYRLLLLDGLSAHVALDVVKWAWDHRIIVLCLPAHTTAHLQPLDVGLFGPLKKAYFEELRRREEDCEAVTKHLFAECVVVDEWLLSHARSGWSRRRARRLSHVKTSSAPSIRPE
jgi:hypothetical protein